MNQSRGLGKGWVPVVLLGLLAGAGVCAAGPLLAFTFGALFDQVFGVSRLPVVLQDLLCCLAPLFLGGLIFVFIKYGIPKLREENSRLKKIFTGIGFALWLILPPLILYAVVYEQLTRGLMSLGADTQSYVFAFGVVLALLWLPALFMLGMSIFLFGSKIVKIKLLRTFSASSPTLLG